MTKIKKKQIVYDLLKQFNESDSYDNSQKLIAQIINEIYSSGYNNPNSYKIVSDAISIFLGDIIKDSFEKSNSEFYNAASVKALITLIDLSQLPD